MRWEIDQDFESVLHPLPQALNDIEWPLKAPSSQFLCQFAAQFWEHFFAALISKFDFCYLSITKIKFMPTYMSIDKNCSMTPVSQHF